MAGFTVEHGPYSVNQKGLHVERTFLPPGCLRCFPEAAIPLVAVYERCSTCPRRWSHDRTH